jgi:hypothetical protein
MKPTKNVQELIEEANKNPDLPKIYANGFSAAMGPSDVTLLLQRSGQSVGILNMSFTTTKTLISKLNGLILFLEDKSKQPIMTIDDINKYMTEKGKNEDS